MKIATVCLTSCTGCHVALLHLGLDFAELLKKADLVYSPVLADFKSFDEADVALIEGAARHEKDVEHLKDVREKSKVVVALGTCASYGGICGLGDSEPAQELYDRAYKESETRFPKLLPRALPIDSFIAVDYYVTGCPPPTKVLADFLAAVVAGKVPKANDRPVCADCSRTVRGDFSRALKHVHEELPDPEVCLLQQGYICLGSVTRAGCEALCPEAGHPCDGCRGPSHKLVLSPSHGAYTDLVKRRSHYLGISEAESRRELDAFIDRGLYKFTLGSPFLRRRNMERVSKLIHRVNVDSEGAVEGELCRGR